MADSDDSETNEDVDDLVPQIGPGKRGSNNLNFHTRVVEVINGNCSLFSLTPGS